MRADGTAGGGRSAHIFTYIKDAGNLLWQKTSRRLIYHQRAQRDDFWLRAVLQEAPGEGVHHELINRVDKLCDG